MVYKLPKPLQRGDTIALLAPSSPMATEGEVDRCVQIVEALDLKVKPYPTLHMREDYLAGTDAQRVRDLHKAFADPKIAAVFAIRGGYGAGRLMHLLDFKAMAESRKLLLGFSDVTALIFGFLKQGKLCALHAPTPSYFRTSNPAKEASFAALKRVLFDPSAPASLKQLAGDWFKPRTIRRGKATGPLIGGNLSLVASLIGTPHFPNLNGAILFLEDVHEKPYRLDRYLTQIIESGQLGKVAGIALGQFNDCNPISPDFDDAAQVLERCLKGVKVPILANLPVGHDDPSFPLMIGRQVELDATNGDLTYI